MRCKQRACGSAKPNLQLVGRLQAGGGERKLGDRTVSLSRADRNLSRKLRAMQREGRLGRKVQMRSARCYTVGVFFGFPSASHLNAAIKPTSLHSVIVGCSLSVRSLARGRGRVWCPKKTPQPKANGHVEKKAEPVRWYHKRNFTGLRPVGKVGAILALARSAVERVGARAGAFSTPAQALERLEYSQGKETQGSEVCWPLLVA